MSALRRAPCRAAGLAVVLGFLSASTALAEDLEYAVSFPRGLVKVEVYRADEKPAVGVKVRLEDASKKIIAAGKINTDGFWDWPIPGPGDYEVVVEAAGPDQKDFHHDFHIKPPVLPPTPTTAPKCEHCPPSAQDAAASAAPEEEKRFPWIELSAAGGLIGVSGLIYWLGRSRCACAPGSLEADGAAPEQPDAN
jgi:hypothetical protein